MQGTIYWFSGRGTSYWIALSLAQRLSCRLCRIRKDRIFREETEGNAVGFVFPVYHATYGESGIPYIVQDFVRQIGDLSKVRVFVVCTHSGIPGMVLDAFRLLVEQRGGRLSVAGTILMTKPYGTVQKMRHVLFHRPFRFDEDNERQGQRKLLKTGEAVQAEVVQAIETGTEICPETGTEICPETGTEICPETGWGRRLFLRLLAKSQRNAAIARFRSLAEEEGDDIRLLTEHSDRSFSVGSSCNGCGLCLRLCPVCNIRLVSGRPEWQHHCQMCFACYTWCPRNAIEGAIVEFEKPLGSLDVVASDLLVDARDP